ncbi:hypothetical protein DY218_25795, partial [Streptomyces triticagri]
GGGPAGQVGRRRSDNAPLFPAGYAGTITHTPRFAIAAVAPGAAGIGVDLEPRRFDPALHRFLFTDEEREQLWPDRELESLRGLYAAKEAGFKALSGGDCRAAHGGLYFRVRLERDGGGRLWARAGEARALVHCAGTPTFGFAVAVRTTDRPAATRHPRPS